MTKTLHTITDRIIERSAATREAYLTRMREAATHKPARLSLPCSNFAHGFAACDTHEKDIMKAGVQKNLAIVTAYNDMLSAHRPYESYPERIREAARSLGATAQVAGGTPAMCDGITQGREGMELSLFSRDVIALSTAIGLSHAMFDGVLCLGICDKIVPGLLMGALSFGHLPCVFVPSGPMPSGLPNAEKARIREAFAKGEVGEDALLEAEAKSYHSKGTCTFYGTANSNQMLMEIMGLQLPGSSFINADTPERFAATERAVHTLIGLNTPLCDIVSERSIVNAMVGLHATGGSTNHTIHLMAIARAAGILINWDDLADLSAITPLLCRLYPNGEADVNHFRDAGGMAFLIRELLHAGLLHDDVPTIAGHGLARYAADAPATSRDTSLLASASAPFRLDGGMKLLQGNLGRAIIKVSALKDAHLRVQAPVRMFTSQEDVLHAFKAGELHRDVIIALLFQGPRANGMPELHALTPALSVLQGMGYQVALLTDGRMSGASGKFPAAIHTTPEALGGGALAKLRDGDVVTLDATTGTLHADVPDAKWNARTPLPAATHATFGMGRELFANFRACVSSAEEGASVII